MTLSAESGKTVTVSFTASAETGDTAESPADFSGFAALGLIFNPGDLTVNQAVVVVDDSIVEPDETFTVTLSNVMNAAISDATAKGTITNDDTAAETCTLNTGDLWCGVVTVGALELFGSTVAYGFTGSVSTSALSDTGFSVGTNNYTIDEIYTGVPGTNAGVLFFSLTSALTATDKAKLVLHVGSDTFAFSAASDLLDSDFTYQWNSTGLDWSSTSEVTLRVREAATPPDAPTEFTAGVGNTQVALAWKAPASDSGVTGHEFRYKTDGDYPLTWTAIANSGPDETNEDSFTVTGLTNEVAHTFELHAVNAAGAGDAAEAGPVTPTPGICDRTQKIQEVILAELSDVDDCAAVTVANLAAITTFGAFGLSTSNQGITSLLKGDFAGLTSLTLLNLSQNTLTSLPEGIFAGLGELTELNLSANQLESLPEGAFSDLTALTILSLNNNDLDSLDAGLFSGLTALDDLFLNGNELSSLPEELFSGLTALDNLYLNDNALESLPEELFSGLTALDQLYLDENDLESLPEGLFSDLTALKSLDLEDNALESLPEGLFSDLTALTRLELQNNALSSLPDELFLGLTALIQLDLSNNSLNALPDELFLGLTALDRLDLSSNSTNPMELTVTVEKVGTNQVRAKVLAGTPFAVDIPVTLVNGTLTGSVTVLGVAAGEVVGAPVTMTRTAGTTTAATVDVDLSTQPTLPSNHMGYEFKKATANLPATILPDATNAAPAFTSSTTFNPAENRTAVGTVEAEDSDPTDAVTGYTLNGGADQALFSINNSGVLTFQAAPNYEDPKDADTDNAYLVTVQATSGTGARVKTADQTITVTVMDADEQPDTPAKPTLAAVSGSSTSLDASWTEPGLNGGPAITGYNVEYRVSTAATWDDFTHTDTTTTTTITGLTAGTSYQVRVQALNGETPSAWSDASDAVSPNSAADATLSALVVNDGNMDLTLTPTFASSKYTYTAMVANTVAEVTVTPTKNDSGATIEYLDEDDATLTDADTGVTGHQVAVAEGDNAVKVKVTAQDTTTTQAYTVTVNRAAPAGPDATLSALVVNDGRRDLTLRPGFAPGTTSYRVGVVNAVAEVTVTATPNDAEAGIDWLDASDMTLTDAGTAAGQQVTLAEGDNVVKVKVTAKDGNTTRTYTVTVTRRAVDAPGVEGDLRLTDEESYTHPDGYEGVSGRAEIFHAGRWGTVSSDGFSRSTTYRFIEDLDTNGDPLGTSTYGEVDNNAPALFCKAMGYTTGEYASGYGRPGVASQPSESRMTYYPVGSTYPLDGPEPIWVDDMTCAAGDADLREDVALPAPMAHCGYAGWGLHNSNHGEDAGVRCWNEPESDAGRSYDPLTAAFEGLPEAHDGETAFSFRLAFSEAVAVTPEAMRTRALTVAGGAATGAARVDGESGVWEITVTPDSREDLSIALAPAEDCEAEGAVCTSDGRTLSAVPAHIVPGPGPETEPALTAELQGLPGGARRGDRVQLPPRVQRGGRGHARGHAYARPDGGGRRGDRRGPRRRGERRVGDHGHAGQRRGSVDRSGPDGGLRGGGRGLHIGRQNPVGGAGAHRARPGSRDRAGADGELRGPAGGA